MKIITLITLALLGSATTVLAQKKAPYQIQGTLSDVPKDIKGMLFLQRYDKDLSLDSTRLTQGNFKFTGATDGPEIANLFYQSASGERLETLVFYIEKGKMKIQAKWGQLDKAIISGSLINTDAQIFDNTHKEIIDSISGLMSAYFEAEEVLAQDSFRMDSPARAAINKIDVGLDKWSALLSKEQVNYAKENPNKALSLFKLQQLLKDVTNQQLVGELYGKLSPVLKKTPLGQELENQLSNMESLKIGDLAPNFSLADTTDKQIQLTELRGKYVLVDFWASWCIPCRVENEHVIKAYEAFKEKGFEVLGISADFALKSWKKAVVDDGLTWINVVDSDNSVGTLYHVKSIPSNFLLDPTGKIIAINLRGEALYEALESIL